VSITLSSRDLGLVNRAVKVLASPFDAPCRDSWRAAANRCLRELSGADSAGFLLPVREGPFVFSEEHDPASLARYPELQPPPLEDGRTVFENAVRRGVSTLAEVYDGRPDLYLASEYYNEYAGPNGAHDSINMFVGVQADGPIPVAAVQLWLGDPRRRFDARQAALVRLALPALQVGVTHFLQWAQHRADLLDSLDELGHAVLVADPAGRTVHRTPALERMLAEDGDAETLEGALREFAHGVCEFGRAAAVTPRPRLQREVTTARARYRLAATLYREVSGSGSLTLVSLERTTAVLRSDAELRAVYGLTRAECRLVPMLVAGLSSTEIARRLTLSVHTVRRHTESILAKTRTNSRAALVSRVLR
jgi:DNA-binding NarL/FixJ family response regulator